MSETRPARPNLTLAVAIWLLVVGFFGAFGLATAAALRAAHAGIAPMPPLQLSLSILSVLLALAGGITLLQMKPLSWPLLIARFAAELILLILVLTHPLALPTSLTANSDTAMTTGLVKTTGTVFGIFWLLVNLAIALYARAVTTAAPPIDAAPAA